MKNITISDQVVIGSTTDAKGRIFRFSSLLFNRKIKK